jgi:hypothetical protein
MTAKTALAALIGLAAALFAAPAFAATLSLVGHTEKVCQATGETDWLTGQPTNAKTASRYGLLGVDLGFPIETDKGRLIFLFGDAWPNNHPPNTPLVVPPDDVEAYTFRTAPPDKTDCLDMNLFSVGPLSYMHPLVTPAIEQGSFNVPTGGVEVKDKIWAFFWTNHCLGAPAGPNLTAPLALPPPGGGCPETFANNILGRSVLAYATIADPTNFKQVAPVTEVALTRPQMPAGFNYVSAAEPPLHVVGMENGQPVMGHGPIPVYGVARYRASIPYLAMAPENTFGDVTTWRFFAGTKAGFPLWMTYAEWNASGTPTQWAAPQGAEVFPNEPNAFSGVGDEHCVGEHSVTWNEPLHVWLMTYTCGGWQVEARWAKEPWGPWSKPTMLLSFVQEPALACHLFWTVIGQNCPGRQNQQPFAFLTFGYLYAPFVMARYTHDATPPGLGSAKDADIYWLLSTWDPYQATVMHSRIRLGP